MADLFTRLAARAHGVNQGYASSLGPRLPVHFESEESAPDHDSGIESPERMVDPTPAGSAPMEAAAEPRAQASPVAAAQLRPAATEAPPPSVAPMSTESPVAAGAEQVSPKRDAVHPALTAALPHADEHEDAGGRVSDVEHMEVGSRIRPVFVGGDFGGSPNGFESTGKQQAKPAERPSVHISIGRIEVRAAPAAPAPLAPSVTAAPPENTGLSLAAYLRGDDGRPK